MNTQLVERPVRGGYAQAAYDVISQMDNKWLSADEIYTLLDDSIRRKKNARSKLVQSLASGVERGMFVFVGESKGNISTKKYRLATMDHRNAMMAKYRKKIAKWAAPAGQWVKQAKPQKKGHGLNGQQERSDLVRAIDSKIAIKEQELAALNEMRKLAMNIGA